MNTKKTFTVVLVDDNSHDLDLIKMAIQQEQLPIEAVCFTSASAALDGIRALPDVDLVITDLNMAPLNGPEFLKCLQADPHLRYLPMAIMSSSPEKHVPFRRIDGLKVPYFEKACTWDGFLHLGRAIHACLSGAAENAGSDRAAHRLAERMRTPRSHAQSSHVQ